MEILLTLIALLALLSFLLKSSFHPRRAIPLAAFALALTIRLTVPWLTRLSPAALAAWIAEPGHLLDGAVCLILEVLLMGAFCFGRAAGRWRFLRFYPGLLAFPAALWCWAQLLYAHPGIDFTRFAWLATVVTLGLVWGGAELLRRLIPEEFSRLEALFLIQLLQFLLIVAITGAITF